MSRSLKRQLQQAIKHFKIQMEPDGVRHPAFVFCQKQINSSIQELMYHDS
jgi:hypothetical protein